MLWCCFRKIMNLRYGTLIFWIIAAPIWSLKIYMSVFISVSFVTENFRNVLSVGFTALMMAGEKHAKDFQSFALFLSYKRTNRNCQIVSEQRRRHSSQTVTQFFFCQRPFIFSQSDFLKTFLILPQNNYCCNLAPENSHVLFLGVFWQFLCFWVEGWRLIWSLSATYRSHVRNSP